MINKYEQEYEEKKKEIVVPPFFKRKVFMVTMLFLISGVLAISATYAWFILSTSPEVTGISSTVGANGSLEIALLNDETGENTSLITADVGDSIYIKGALEGNITWGNLVDLSDISYGLSTMVLYPSIINVKDDLLDTTSMLCIPHNGLDGRITKIDTNTVCASYNGTIFESGKTNYGVKAVGAKSTASSRSAYLSSAKASYEANKASALASCKNALKDNGTSLITIASGSSTLSVNDLTQLQALVYGYKNAYDYILTAYKQVIIATAAANNAVSDADFDLIRIGVANADALSLSTYTSNFSNAMSMENLSKLNDYINDASSCLNVLNSLLYNNYGTEDQEPVDASTTYPIAQISAVLNKITDTSTLSIGRNINGDTLTLYEDAGDGLIRGAADYLGDYTASSGNIYIASKTNINDGNGLFSQIDISNLTATKSATTENTNNSLVTDFYGYVVDLAFRTNVSADLQLQTNSIDRIYTDGAGATMGSGSKVIYTYAQGMTETQIDSLLSAVRVCYFNPDDGTIYGIAKLGEIENDGLTATASLYVMDDENEIDETSESSKLIELEAAVPSKVSLLVYLDGNYIDNMSVFNGDNSGSILFNFQFSSSAELNPMVDSDIKNATGSVD